MTRDQFDDWIHQLIAESGIVSLLAVVYVFGIIIVSHFGITLASFADPRMQRNALRRRKEYGWRWRVFEDPTDLLLVCSDYV